MDEVGLMVESIMANGGIKVIPIGGLMPEVFISQVLYVQTDDKQIPGVIGAVPPHISKKGSMDFKDLIFDVGLNDKEAVLKAGIDIGQMVLPKTPFTYTVDKKKVIAKAVDNRWGCGMSLELIRDLHESEFDYNLALAQLFKKKSV